MSRWWMVLALVVLAGCASNKAMAPGNIMTDSASGGEAVDGAQSAQDEVDALVRQIEAASGSYREEFGIEDPQAGGGGGGETPTDLAVQEPTSCETVCEAAKAICGSGDRICTIASQNPGYPEFGERCAWAGEQCAKARSGCEACGQ